MDSDKIDQLLNKYWNCETSLEEEQQLQTYFQKGPFPEQLKETASVFRYFSEYKKKTLTHDTFDRQIINKVKAPTKERRVRLLFNTMRIAAGITVLMVATWLIRTEVRKTTPQDMADTYNDPKLAFEETKKALMMISKSFGTAEEQAKKINLFNKAQEGIRKKETKSEL